GELLGRPAAGQRRGVRRRRRPRRPAGGRHPRGERQAPGRVRGEHRAARRLVPGAGPARDGGRHRPRRRGDRAPAGRRRRPPRGLRPPVGRRTADEIRTMRRAGRVVAEMHERIAAAIRPGATLRELDAIGREVLARRGARSNFLGYHGYPAVICASVNEVVVHGIPDHRRLEEGDIVSIDCGAVVDGYHGDAAFTAAVGGTDPVSERLVEVTRRALEAGIAELVPGARLGDLGAAVQATIEGAGFNVVREYVGHGIGTAMHEPPDVPNVGRRGRGRKVSAGDVFAVEPMACAGDGATRVLDDGWTVVTVDGSRAAHWEHTVAVTDDGPEVLTLP